ncbi:MAG: hypothetical protein KJO34_03365 [Deltaproteobacteria bacterium]|nr:hypothetical protein [Deltaproteobacteria bacterium]
MRRGKWKEIAWNEIQFKVPESWEIAEIGVRHLIFEDESGPTMEVKWAPVRGKFSHRAHLKRIGAFQPRKVKKTVKEWLLSPQWEEALSGFQTSGFSWHTQTKTGLGIILYCPVCRNAALIQFLQQKDTHCQEIPLRVLQTFQDHRDDDQVAWSVFDIRALMPASFKLVTHRFEPGNFELAFEHRTQNIFLYRWAPASVLLAGQDLMQFAKSISDFSAGDAVPVDIDSGPAVALSSTPRFIWFSRFRAKPSFHWLGLWHLKSKNRILGVKMQGKRAFDTLTLDKICAGYESL